MASLGIESGLSGLDYSVLWDGRGQPVSGGFREGSIDGIVCDLPWGVRELSINAVGRLYPALLRMLGHACSQGAIAIFLCAREKVFFDAVRQNEKYWEILSTRVSS